MDRRRGWRHRTLLDVLLSMRTLQRSIMTVLSLRNVVSPISADVLLEMVNSRKERSVFDTHRRLVD
jgi:hypothetical protein